MRFASETFQLRSLTANEGGERRADDVEVAEADGDGVLAGRGGHVRELVALVDLRAGDGRARRARDGDDERADAGA